jgi:hypothetical protein
MKADEKLTNHIGQVIAQNTNDATAKQYGNNLANLLKDLNIEAQIEKGTYYLRSVSISGKLAYYGSVSDASAPEIGFTLSSSFDNFGKNVTLSAPTETMSYEDFVNGLNNITAQFGLYVGGNQSAQDDTTRISDLRTIQAALELYDTDCGQYPQQLDLLVGGSYCAGKNIKYLKSVPQDPSGADYYYKLDDQGTYDLCANLSATPSADYNNCPNDSYNYHLISPRFAL